MKRELQAKAVALRAEGYSINDLAEVLGVAKSTAWRWVRHLPLDPDADRARRKREHSKLMTDAQWSQYRAERDRRRSGIESEAELGVGTLSERELLLLGAAIYWCEGKKAKPWRPDDTYLVFTNSDPVLLALFIRFVEAAGVQRGALSYRVSIHESADADAAAAWWAGELRLDPTGFRRPTLKRHIPTTTRHNIGRDYHGCLVVRVPRNRELYWRVNGIVRGVAAAIAGSRTGTV